MSDSTTTERTSADTAQSTTNPAHGAPGGAAPNATRPDAPRKRKLWLALLSIGVALSGAAYGAYYFSYGQYHESTDDAYVDGNLVQLTPQVTGTVNAVNADDTQIVKEGDPVVTLDPADSRIALLNAEAALGQAVRQVSTLYVNNNYYAANVAQRESDLARAQDDLRRRVAVQGTGAVSAEDVSHAHDTVVAAQAALDAARQQAQSNLALTDRTSIEQHPDVQAAATQVRNAYLNYARNTLPAPVTGYVAQRSVQVGQRVGPGTPLMSIVPLDGVWVDANFKEVQLHHMRIGQPVTMTADVYGSSVKYHGKVIGFSAGTGSAFATLPAQNATGNWIKIVQRLPVRIQLDPKELQAHPLRIGLSMVVDADTRDESGTQLAAAVNTTYRTDVFAQYGAQADAEIEKIIASNEMAQQAKAASPRVQKMAQAN
ncbi:HlyD family efflux transporter periplasmic adaptor subunit [Paraburkholderia pallida]|uniref:HlyD family efflux transporter periplasmic adaptor subunit n=1 Tax=Paraburkholderia pallida TaxID=2547399 RepID=A0A4P7D4U5_9BURK|nr:HlyD family efflux transporter periplasmic adaptor subunit [Paraburkholderia pallida]QBR03068.1 HlyD family efflux transporter periplasmic adaptor subunit [Paraburkholderia pallida]